MSYSIQDSMNLEDENSSDPNYHTISNSISKQSKTINKTKTKPKQPSKKGKKQKKTSSEKQNWGRGGPGRPEKPNFSVSEEDLGLEIKEILSEQWFGRNITTCLLIFLCQRGNMILKVKTGQPAVKSKGRFTQGLDEKALKIVKKFKKVFKKQLKDKFAKILKYLQYPDDTTYLFLDNNMAGNLRLQLPDTNSRQTNQGLQILMKYLSSRFTPTYKLIIEYYYFCQDKIDEEITSTIVDKLKANKQDHKMIFDMQLIQELMKSDFDVMSQIVLQHVNQENNPSEAQIHSLYKTCVSIPDFTSNTFKDQEEEIKEQSTWISVFVLEVISILKAFP